MVTQQDVVEPFASDDCPVTTYRVATLLREITRALRLLRENRLADTINETSIHGGRNESIEEGLKFEK